MNIIEAWKAANKGQTIGTDSFLDEKWTKRTDEVIPDLHDALKYAIEKQCVSSEGWKVLKEKKTSVFEMCCSGNVFFYNDHGRQIDGVKVPAHAKVVITWEE